MGIQRGPSPLGGGEGEEKQGNKTVMSSQEFADGTHTYMQVK